MAEGLWVLRLARTWSRSGAWRLTWTFKALVKEGDKVKAGTPLLKVDLDAIRAAGHPTATAIIVTNGDDLGELKMLAEGDVLAGTPLFKF